MKTVTYTLAAISGLSFFATLFSTIVPVEGITMPLALTFLASTLLANQAQKLADIEVPETSLATEVK